MKSALVFSTLATALLMSCSATRYGSLASSRDEINDRARDNTADVYLRDSATASLIGPIAVVNLRFGSDSATWFDERTLTMATVAGRDVAAVEFSSSGTGFLEGLAIGGLGGGLVGGFLGMQAGEGVLWGAMTPLYTAFSAGVGVVAGGLVGGIIGSVAGSEKRYEFSVDTLAPSRR